LQNPGERNDTDRIRIIFERKAREREPIRPVLTL
jgi:hypothetical protein